MEVGPASVFLSSRRNETIGWLLEGLRKMIRLRVSGIVAKIPNANYQLLLDGNCNLLLKYREVNG